MKKVSLWLHAKVGQEVLLSVGKSEVRGFVISRGIFKIHIHDYIEPDRERKIPYRYISKWAIL